MNIEKCNDYWSGFHDALNRIGVGVGDILYIASDLMKILVQARPELEINTKAEQFQFVDMLIDELKKHVTEEGTLLFPVYSWDFCKGKGFDYRKTQGEVGVLNNYVLNNRKDFVRTFHPIYSFMVWGKDAQLLLDMRNQDSWGTTSPFRYLHENKAKELDLNVSLKRSFTFKHYVEQSVGVPYRHPKYFLGEYTDARGQTEVKCFSMYVRDLSVQLVSNQQIDFFMEKGCASQTEFKKWDISVVDLSLAYSVVEEDLLHNGGKHIYDFTDYEVDFSTKQPVYEIGYLRNQTLL